MSGKYSSDETEAVPTHVMDEQPENLSDHNFCLILVNNKDRAVKGLLCQKD